MDAKDLLLLCLFIGGLSATAYVYFPDCPGKVTRKLPPGADCVFVTWIVNNRSTANGSSMTHTESGACIPETSSYRLYYEQKDESGQILDRCDISITVQGVCSWHPYHCWPGDCANNLSSNCQCRPGFIRRNSYGCDLNTPPHLDACQVAVINSQGKITNSTNGGARIDCNRGNSQGIDYINTPPAQLSFLLRANLTNDVGPTVPYVKETQVGIVGATVTVIKVPVIGTERTILRQSLVGPPYCQDRVDTMNPVVNGSFHQCEATNLSLNLVSLKDGESVCVSISASAGGYYKLQDYNGTYQGTETFSQTQRHRRACFLYDEIKPVHCIQIKSRCSSKPFRLSARTTRYPEVEVHVEGWTDPNPPGVSPSGIKGFRVEVHDVHVGKTNLTVLDDAIPSLTRTWNANSSSRLAGGPYDVTVTLPQQEAEARLYALILEVQDKAGNVRYARRLVLVDNSSSVELNTSNSLSVVHASPSCNHRWQTDVSRELCVDWAGRFYNTDMSRNNLLMKVDRDNGRGIFDHYDQSTGLLSVSGTDNINGVTKFEIAWSVDQSPKSNFTEVTDMFAQTTCLKQQPLHDGETYHVWIRAGDIMNNTKVDSVRVSIDHSEPELSAEVNISAETVVINVTDPHSGMSTLDWTLTSAAPAAGKTSNSSLSVQRLKNGMNCSGLDHCYCPSVGDCEIYTYPVPFTTLSQLGKLHGYFNLMITAVNGACLRSTVSVLVLLPMPSTLPPSTTQSSTQLSPQSSTPLSTQPSTLLSTQASTQSPLALSTGQPSTRPSTQLAAQVSTKPPATGSIGQPPTQQPAVGSIGKSSSQLPAVGSIGKSSTQLPAVGSIGKSSSQLPAVGSIGKSSSQLPAVGSVGKSSTQLPTVGSIGKSSTQQPAVGSIGKSSTQLPAVGSIGKSSSQLPAVGSVGKLSTQSPLGPFTGQPSYQLSTQPPLAQSTNQSYVQPSTHSSSLLLVGYIVGSIVGLLLVVGIIASIWWFCCKKRMSAYERKGGISPYPDPIINQRAWSAPSVSPAQMWWERINGHVQPFIANIGGRKVKRLNANTKGHRAKPWIPSSKHPKDL